LTISVFHFHCFQTPILKDTDFRNTMVFIDIHFTLALLWGILTCGYNIWLGFTTQAPCMQLLVGSLIQVLLVDMSYLTYLWSQCLSSCVKILRTSELFSQHTLWCREITVTQTCLYQQAQTLQFFLEKTCIEIY